MVILNHEQTSVSSSLLLRHSAWHMLLSAPCLNRGGDHSTSFGFAFDLSQGLTLSFRVSLTSIDKSSHCT